MRIIREEYLQKSTVTAILIGWETAKHPYVNSEIRSSLRNTSKNKHNGLIAIIRDDLYDAIYRNSICADCGSNGKIRNTSLFETYIPSLERKIIITMDISAITIKLIFTVQ